MAVFCEGVAVKQFIFWNRRSGADRRDREDEPGNYLQSDDRRVMDRRLYGDNGFVLIIGHTGLDRFTLFVTLPTLAATVVALILSSSRIF